MTPVSVVQSRSNHISYRVVSVCNIMAVSCRIEVKDKSDQWLLFFFLFFSFTHSLSSSKWYSTVISKSIFTGGLKRKEEWGARCWEMKQTTLQVLSRRFTAPLAYLCTRVLFIYTSVSVSVCDVTPVRGWGGGGQLGQWFLLSSLQGPPFDMHEATQTPCLTLRV